MDFEAADQYPKEVPIGNDRALEVVLDEQAKSLRMSSAIRPSQHSSEGDLAHKPEPSSFALLTVNSRMTNWHSGLARRVVQREKILQCDVKLQMGGSIIFDHVLEIVKSAIRLAASLFYRFRDLCRRCLVRNVESVINPRDSRPARCSSQLQI